MTIVTFYAADGSSRVETFPTRAAAMADPVVRLGVRDGFAFVR